MDFKVNQVMCYTPNEKFSLFQMEPSKRICAEDAMKHEYFWDLPPKVHDLPDGKYFTVLS